MIDVIVAIIAIVVITEAATELVVKSKIFSPVRGLFKDRENKVLQFFYDLLVCGHCFSVWASLLVCTVFFVFWGDFFSPDKKFVQLFLLILLVHRLSNYLHMSIDRIDKFYRKD